MNQAELKEVVRNWYGGVAAGGAGCCGSTATPQEASCSMGYSEAELASLPEGADLGLGCGTRRRWRPCDRARWSSNLDSRRRDRLLPGSPPSGSDRKGDRRRHDA